MTFIYAFITPSTQPLMLPVWTVVQPPGMEVCVLFIIFLKPRMLLCGIGLAKKFVWVFSVTYRKSCMSFFSFFLF